MWLLDLELGTPRPQHPILFRGSNNISPLWPGTDHWLHIHRALRERRDELYTAASLKTHFATTPKTCIIKCLINSGFFYLIRTAEYSSYQSIPNWCNLGLELDQTTLYLFIDHTSDASLSFIKLYSVCWLCQQMIFFSVQTPERRVPSSN